MKKLSIILFYVGLLLPVVVFAQKADSSKNNSVKKIYDLIHIKGKPLIVIDGIIYNEDSKPFDTNDIAAIEVLNPPGSENIYGKRAKDGAILINTKNLQTVPADTYASIKLDSITYILNGKPSTEKELKTLDPNSVLTINILKNAQDSLSNGSQRVKTLMVITKSYAIKSYQDKLSSLSKQYEQYLKAYHNDDKLLFIINGVKYQFSSRERIEKLYNIFFNDGVSNKFELTYVSGIDSIPSSLNINTN
ncbi:hypothetical protein SAMN05192574_12060 [Mucilaginibacter gossypiicola]|uniref:TonB-dependent receptor plug domain-containing protein n=1 Tax=Mucilaginibacter gossypiicola TaxID=551995 RepID=A0A1H8USM2_9SPHI|nr:hypothetical protein [Mucilaginibacter gossypiicola]SEP05914.1 hypothetical protein SAMN05192574_12060 [Mucilaginibacter gossypiicola]